MKRKGLKILKRNQLTRRRKKGSRNKILHLETLHLLSDFIRRRKIKKQMESS